MYSFDYKKSLGQNFLMDKNIIYKISDSISPNEDDLIIEIGPGAGALTKELVKKNCDVLCFEIDRRLEETLSKIESDRLKVVFNDFLKVNLSSYIDKKYKNIYFVGNLPYYITTAIINKILDESDPKEIVVMIQKEVGERFMASPRSKQYNSLSVFLQYNFDILKICDVNKNCFEPIPKVDSVVVKLIKNKKIIADSEEIFYKLIKDAFKQKRKNLKNNLVGYDLNLIEKELEKTNKSLRNRAEELTIEDFVNISNKIHSKKNQS